MKWTEKHDILLGRELLLMKPYKYKPGTKESGAAWTSVAEDLNKVTEVSFNVSQKAVRDRTKLLIDKFKRKMREEEASSGTVQEQTELDILLEEVKCETDEASEKYEAVGSSKKKEQEKYKADAESIRNIAMENLTDTRKRKSLDGDSPTSSSKKRNHGSETMAFLMAKLDSDKELRNKELEMKKLSLEREQQQSINFQALLEQQRQLQINQQQQNHLMLQLMQSLLQNQANNNDKNNSEI